MHEMSKVVLYNDYRIQLMFSALVDQDLMILVLIYL